MAGGQPIADHLCGRSLPRRCAVPRPPGLAGRRWPLAGLTRDQRWPERVEGSRQRRTVKTEHHALLGSYFLTHPPICKIRVEANAADSPLTRGLRRSFVVECEPYF